MAKKSKHIHRYERAVLGKEHLIWKCNLPGCTHFIEPSLVKGRLSLCNRCNEPMIMNAFSMSFTKPHCANCTKKKDEKREVLNKLEEFVNAKDNG